MDFPKANQTAEEAKIFLKADESLNLHGINIKTKERAVVKEAAFWGILKANKKGTRISCKRI